MYTPPNAIQSAPITSFRSGAFGSFVCITVCVCRRTRDMLLSLERPQRRGEVLTQAQNTRKHSLLRGSKLRIKMIDMGWPQPYEFTVEEMRGRRA